MPSSFLSLLSLPWPCSIFSSLPSSLTLTMFIVFLPSLPSSSSLLLFLAFLAEMTFASSFSGIFPRTEGHGQIFRLPLYSDLGSLDSGVGSLGDLSSRCAGLALPSVSATVGHIGDDASCRLSVDERVLFTEEEEYFDLKKELLLELLPGSALNVDISIRAVRAAAHYM